MCSRAIVVLAALILAPLGAQAADLVVWWEEGYYAQEDEALREIIAAFEQEQRQAGRARLLSAGRSCPTRSRRRSRPAGRPTSPSASSLATTFREWAFEDRLVDLTDTVGSFSNLFDPNQLDRAMLLNARTGQRALYGLPMGRIANHVHVWKSLLEQAASRSTTSPRSGSRSGRSGATRCSRRCARRLGRDDIWGIGLPMSVEANDTVDQFFQFVAAYEADYVTRDGQLVIDDPEIRQRLVKAIDSYTAIYRKGCTPPDSVTWDDGGNNEAFLAQTVVMTPNYALDPERAQARASGRLLREHRDHRMATWPARRALPDPRRVLPRGGLQGRRQRRHRQGVRPLPRGRGLADALSRLLRRAHAAIDTGAARPAVLARPERPAPHGRGDAGRVAPAALTITPPPRAIWRHDQVYNERVWAKAIHRIVTEGISPEQAVDEAIARIKQILSE